MRSLTARGPRIVAVGDSHAHAVGRAGRALGWPTSVCVVRGATAQGLVNPNSQTNAMLRFEQRCRFMGPGQTLVFLLGEVDCGFVIWYRAEKHGVSIDSQIERSLEGYMRLLQRQVSRGRRVVVLSVPPPTIEDGQDWGEIANARRQITATLRQRTDLTLEYNARLQAACERLRVPFVDVTTPTFDADSGLVAAEYRHPRTTNHHLHPERYAALIADRLAAVLTAKTDAPRLRGLIFSSPAGREAAPSADASADSATASRARWR